MAARCTRKHTRARLHHPAPLLSLLSRLVLQRTSLLLELVLELVLELGPVVALSLWRCG